MADVADSDRRRHHRARIPKITGTFRSPGDVLVLDLSLAGLSFETTGELQPGDRCYLELHHPSGTASVEVEVRWASVLRVEKSERAMLPVFRAGGAFLDVQSDGAGGLLDWLVVDPEPAAAQG